MESIVIAFGYKAGHGKDESVKAVLAARSGQYDVRRYAFADALKKEVNAAADVFGEGRMDELFEYLRECGIEQQNGASLKIPDWVTYDPDADMTDPLCPLGKQRKLLQWWGSEYRREQDPFYWVTKMQETIEKDKPAVALISDLRFPNEMSWVTANKGYAVRVDRLGYSDGKAAGHHSEELLSWVADEDWHYIIQVNDGDVEELRADAVIVFDHIIEQLTPPDLRDIEKFHFMPGDLAEEVAA